ncbi:hypothetical protein MTR67_001041 [Solanum verrucosum]|uniref:AIPP2-like SPOC-like domain-containing protein n=1 Tax=Solanum verrucosum TaxID=315347 RepID=A0AAF0T753_SOLVR|nr:hypothetical protein MTR67_001041 [Solanum verrucosum]
MMGYYVDARVDWCCEEFDIGKGIMFSSSGLENAHYEGPMLPASEKIYQSTVQPKKHCKFPGGHRINWVKEVQTMKMRYLHVEEALGLSSSINKYGSPRINMVSSRVVPTKSMATVARECDIGKEIMFSSSGLENVHYEGPRLPFSENICQSTVQPKKHSKFPGGHRINSVKVVRTGKMIYLYVEEALGLSSRIKKYGPLWTNTVSSTVVSTKSMETVAPGIFSKPRAQISNSLCEKSKVQWPLRSTVDWCCEECDIGKGIMFSSSGLENVHYEGPMLPASEKICQSIVQPKKHSKFPGGHRINWEKEGCFDILGSLEFVPGMLNSYILAHPPSIVRRKVYEFSGLLPDTVKSELDHRGNNWESLFNNHIPGKEDIGLYFFSSEKERKSTDVRLSAIAVGTANRGGLAKLSIQGNNICRGVTDICLKDIARGFHLNWIRENNNNESSRPLL